jgi:Tn3 transposase DDE domain-containing protein
MATTSKGRCSGRSATAAPAAPIRRVAEGRHRGAVMLRKLAAYRRQDQLDLALQELGRIERTLFMLDWLESPGLRRRCHAGLNKSEQRHFLAKVICTSKQGRQTRPDCRPQCRGAAVSCLRPQPRHRRDRVLELRLHRRRHHPSPCEEQSVPDAWLAHTSPLSWEHVGFSGDFLRERAAATADKRRPLNLGQTRVAA